MLNTIINGLMFNITWLAIVLSHSDLLAPGLVLLHLLIHYLIMGRGLVEARLIVLVTLFGFGLDQVLFRAGVFTQPGAGIVAPLWLSCLWPVLATTLMHAFSSLQERVYLAVVLGASGGAMSYIAGTRLSEIAFGSSSSGPWIMAALWAVLFPLMLRGAKLNCLGEGVKND